MSEIVCVNHKNAQTKLARSQRQMHSCIQCVHHSVIHVFNPFTAVLAAPSLGKSPVKVPNFKTKPLNPFCPLLMGTCRERISIKMDNIESRFIIGPSDILFGGVNVCTFLSPEILQPAAVKGLKSYNQQIRQWNI